MTLRQLAGALAVLNKSPAGGLDWRKLDLGHVRQKLKELSDAEPDLKWAVVDKRQGSAAVFEDLFDAPEELDRDRNFIAACRVREGNFHLRMQGVWREFPATRAAW
jgi:hypothetical protein